MHKGMIFPRVANILMVYLCATLWTSQCHILTYMKYSHPLSFECSITPRSKEAKKLMIDSKNGIWISFGHLLRPLASNLRDMWWFLKIWLTTATHSVEFAWWRRDLVDWGCYVYWKSHIYKNHVLRLKTGWIKGDLFFVVPVVTSLTSLAKSRRDESYFHATIYFVPLRLSLIITPSTASKPTVIIIQLSSLAHPFLLRRMRRCSMQSLRLHWSQLLLLSELSFWGAEC